MLGLQADEFANLTAAEKEAEGRYAVWKTLLELQEKVIDWTTGPLLSRQDNSVCSFHCTSICTNCPVAKQITTSQRRTPIAHCMTAVLKSQVRLHLETIRADVEEFGGKAYRMGKGSKDDAVVALLKDQLDEFKQVQTALQTADGAWLLLDAGVTKRTSSSLVLDCAVLHASEGHADVRLCPRH